MKTLIQLLSLILISATVFAQDYDEWVKQQEQEMSEMKKEYEQYVKEETERFNNYVKQRDKEFAEFLKSEWKAFEVFKGNKVEDMPGPDKVPVFKPVKKIKIKSITVDKPVIELKERQNISSSVPVLPPAIDQSYSHRNITSNFYGEVIFVRYDKETIKYIPADKINEKLISVYWSKTAETKYFDLLERLLYYKTNLNLNDWGYYLLVKHVSEKIIPESENASNLFTWFLLNKSGYKAKVGYTDKKIYLMLPTESELYGIPYLTEGSLKYYTPKLKNESIRTYKGNFPDAKIVFDMNIYSPLNIDSKPVAKELKFKYDEKEYSINVAYNKSLIDFYNDYPQASIDIFFNSSLSRYAKESVIEQLKPIIKNKTKTEAINILLRFVQTAFEYKTDQEQFGKEKFYFPEEILHYAYSDCEDRSVFFAYIVKELLDLKVIGLNYPGHIATAVRINEDVYGDYFTHDGDKYFVCDPTFINAPVGLTMPQFINTKPELVEIMNIQNEEAGKKEIWKMVMKAGGNKAYNGQDLVFDSNKNAYLTGYVAGKAKLGNIDLSSSNEEDKDLFFAKVNSKKEIVWAKKITGTGTEMGYGIELSPTGDIYITGSFDKELKAKNKTIKTTGNPDVFLAKVSGDGNLLWINKIGLDSLNKNTPHKNYLANFDKEGNIKELNFFAQTKYFDAYGIDVDAQGNASLSGSFGDALAISVSNKSFNSANTLDMVEMLTGQTAKLAGTGDYNKEIAGLIAFINNIRSVGVVVEGPTIQKAILKNNPNFAKDASDIYNSIGKMQMIKNSSGIISIKSSDKTPISLDMLKINHNSKIRLVQYMSGDSRINVLYGLKVGTGLVKYDLNYIKIVKANGDLLFDYDDDHTQKRVNMKNDILN